MIDLFRPIGSLSLIKCETGRASGSRGDSIEGHTARAVPGRNLQLQSSDSHPRACVSGRRDGFSRKDPGSRLTLFPFPRNSKQDRTNSPGATACRGRFPCAGLAGELPRSLIASPLGLRDASRSAASAATAVNGIPAPTCNICRRPQREGPAARSAVAYGRDQPGRLHLRTAAALAAVVVGLFGFGPLATAQIGAGARQPGHISTFAGAGKFVPADGGPALRAGLQAPRGVVVDGAGNLYIADPPSHRIRKVDRAGRITTVAGNGVRGLSGDGGPATAAQLAFPHDVAVDAVGNLYIADTNNHRVRRVDLAGTITTAARLDSPSGLAVDAAGNVYIAELWRHRVRKVDRAGAITSVAGTGARGDSGDGGPATAARLDRPDDVAVDAGGNLYIADSSNGRIRKVDAAGTITTVAGTGTAGNSGDGGLASAAQISPNGVAVDAAGNVYIAELWRHRVRKVDAAGTITTVAGTGTAGDSGDGGPAAAARLSAPAGVAADTLGNLYIADSGNHRIRQVAVARRMTGGPPPSQPGDDRADDASGATRPGLNPSLGGAVETAGDEDWFRRETSGQRALEARSSSSNAGSGSDLFVPVILTASGASSSYYASELALTNRGGRAATLRFTYRAAAGGGSGTASETLAPGRQKIVPNAIDYLRGLGVPIPSSGNRVGTLRVGVSGSSGVSVTARTTTRVADGRAGLAYRGVAVRDGFSEAAYLSGLRQNRRHRSDVAFQNMGFSGNITLRTTVFSGDPEAPGSRVMPDVVLAPGDTRQLDAVLATAGFSQGYVKVERVGGAAPFYAYGVINDLANSGGSFVFPVAESSLAGVRGQTLPLIIEHPNLSTELILTNFSDEAKAFDVHVAAAASGTPGKTATVTGERIPPGGQAIIRDAVQVLRESGADGIGPRARTIGGAVFFTAPAGDLSGVAIGARTGSPGGGGQYSVLYNAVPHGAAFDRTAWIDGLQQNEENRSNLALVNTGEVDDSPSVFRLDIYDGTTGMSAHAVAGLRVAARGWRQIDGILARYAPSTTQGYVRIQKISGNNPFLAYGVINDGGVPGQGSGDGAYLPPGGERRSIDDPGTTVATDRAALEALYEATDGPNWVNSDNWLTDAPLGEWYGVETDASGRVVSIQLAGQGEVQGLVRHGLQGPIPPELGDLTDLEVLDLHGNALTGPIPPELGRLRNLQELRLSENGLWGQIPPELGLLQDLRRLNLRLNLLTGSIPPTIGKLAKLEVLWFEHNRLEGALPPELGDLSEMRSMVLGSNELEGPIPPQLGRLNRLVRLSLSFNNLSGPIPPELGNLARLGSLALNQNQLTGPIPPELGSLTNLTLLFLSGNALTGPIPPWLPRLTRLRNLSLHSNALTGPIPPELGSLADLTRLSLGGNQLTGPIPPELGDLNRLERLGLELNRLSGPVPPELGNLHGLVGLGLSGNRLTGSIPKTFLALNNLVTLGCRKTEGACLPSTDAFREWAQHVEFRGGIQLAVNIPWCDEIDAQALQRLYDATNGSGWAHADGWLEDENLGGWYGVRTDSIGRVAGLDLRGNRMSGRLPDALGQLANLTELRIGDNEVGGRLPLSLARVRLEVLDYGGTSLCVPEHAGFRAWLAGIPRHSGTGQQCGPLTEREVLERLYWSMEGPSRSAIGGWLTDASLAEWDGVETNATGQIVALRLRGRGLSGSIPQELGRLSELRELDLRHNRFSGPIPPELWGLRRLRILRLERNQLSGEIPPGLGRLSELRELDLDNNQFSGPIPPELWGLRRLQILRLGWNQLSGEIPPELGRLSELRELDLRFSRLSGSIPPELGGLGRLQKLRLEWNELSGEIPPELGQLSELRDLELRGNRLTGPIPPQLGALRHLSLLDLRRNQLTGAVPAALGRLANLRELNFFDNNLSGTIPATLGNLEKLVKLNLGENGLSGPLPAELGDAAKLEDLDLRANALAGPVPPEFGNLALMKSLILADNPGLAGALPRGITALGQLERFMAGGTGLCRPAAYRFDAWFRGIADRRLVRCVGGAAVYLTQAVQSWDDPVPLLAGEPALLRVFVTARQGAATMPDVRATFYVDGAERHRVHIPASPRTIPAEVMEDDLALSANAEVPDWVIAPGLEMVIEVDPEGRLDPALGASKRIPAAGRMAVDVRAMPPLHLTLVPMLHESGPDWSIVESVQAMAADPDGHPLLADVRTLLPIKELAVTAHDPVTTSFQFAYRLLEEIDAMRLMEGGSGYWMGIIQPPPKTGGKSFYYLLPRGVAHEGGTASVSIREPSVIAHELGHNLALQHAPCGGPRRTDPWFPYPGGNTGAWGYDFTEKALVAPQTPDLMSYCKQSGYWISDFLFNKALNHRLVNEGSSAAAQTSAADPVRSLLLWGGRDEDGLLYLDPALVVEAAPSLPAAGGEYTIAGRAADGTAIFSFPFDMPVTADAEGGATSFVFALPVQAGWDDTLASITLSGPGGSAVLDENTDRPIAILRDPQSGRVRSFLRDPPPPAETGRGAAGVSPARALEVIRSRGLPDLANR